jgi:putative tryptophan/tyrosine transport system substrate-binding protein
MRRREFIAGLGFAAAWPLVARAQQPAVPVVGYLGLTSASTEGASLAPFRQGLSEVGYVEGQNVTIEYRWAEGQYGRMPALAAELVRRRVNVIYAANTTSALAAKAATSNLPIVFRIGDDPVKFGLAASLNRPGGNATGVSLLTTVLESKRLALLRELVPTAETIAALMDPKNPNAEKQSQNLQEAARAVGWRIHILQATTAIEIDAAFMTLVQQRAGALIVSPDAFFGSRRNQITTLAAYHRIPTIYSTRAFVEADGLISYGNLSNEQARQAGIYVGRILKGEHPADLPIVQSTKFELVINAKTANALGLTIPETLLATADEVIQ